MTTIINQFNVNRTHIEKHLSLRKQCISFTSRNECLGPTNLTCGTMAHANCQSCSVNWSAVGVARLSEFGHLFPFCLFASVIHDIISQHFNGHQLTQPPWGSLKTRIILNLINFNAQKIYFPTNRHLIFHFGTDTYIVHVCAATPSVAFEWDRERCALCGFILMIP